MIYMEKKQYYGQKGRKSKGGAVHGGGRARGVDGMRRSSISD